MLTFSVLPYISLWHVLPIMCFCVYVVCYVLLYIILYVVCCVLSVIYIVCDCRLNTVCPSTDSGEMIQQAYPSIIQQGTTLTCIQSFCLYPISLYYVCTRYACVVSVYAYFIQACLHYIPSGNFTKTVLFAAGALFQQSVIIIHRRHCCGGRCCRASAGWAGQPVVVVGCLCRVGRPAGRCCGVTVPGGQTSRSWLWGVCARWTGQPVFVVG